MELEVGQDVDLDLGLDSSATSNSVMGMASACKEYITRFHGQQALGNYPNQDVIRFMLEHSIIKKKIDEWLAQEADDVTGLIVIDDFDNLNIDPIGTRLLYKKCHEYGQMKRTAGNRLFQQKKLKEALECYNEALRNCAFLTDEHLIDVGKCLANRSAVSFEMGKRAEALQDINAALDKYKYPDDLKSKVYLRKLSILIKLHEFDAAEDLLKMCYDWYPELHKKLNEIKETVQTCDKNPLKTENIVPNTSFGPNPSYEAAFSAIEAKYSGDYGRHVIANEELKLGDVIYCEQPFASVLLPDYYNSHCYQCHRELNPHTFFPCKNCTQVNYCNESCSTDSWRESHQYECRRLKFLSSTGIAHLALRIVLTAGVAEVLRTVAEFKEQKSRLKLESDLSIFEPGGARPYSRVYSLLDHMQDINPEDAFQYALTASLLTHFLQTRTTFLKDTKLDEDEIVGGAILRHICQLICNANAISSVQTESKNESGRIDEFSQVRMATAIYPSASLMNHSCSPNILSAFRDGRTIVVKIAVDTLQAGSEIFNCYGPHFRRMNYKTRQENLGAQYFFTCKCSECAKELTENSSFADKFSAFKCTHCDGPVHPDYNKQNFVVTCGSCHNSVNLKQSMELALKTDQLFSKGMELMDRGDIRKALDEFIKCYDLRKKILYPFHSDLGNFSDCLTKCYSILGNFSAALKFTIQSLEYVQERFGINSIEWAREFKKYIDLKSSCQVEELPAEDGVECGGSIQLQDPDKLQKLNELADKMLNLYKSS